jgi:hypothetical protein
VLGRVALWLRPSQLAVDLDAGATHAALPVSLGLQLTPTLWAQADLDYQLGELRDGQLVLPAVPPLPVALGAVISVHPSVDLRVRVAGDLGGGPGGLSWLVGLGWIVGA